MQRRRESVGAASALFRGARTEEGATRYGVAALGGAGSLIARRMRGLATRAKQALGLDGEGRYRHLLVYAPPGWALFELVVADLGDGEGPIWRVNEWQAGEFNFGDDLAGRLQAMDEFVILKLRVPNARLVFEDEMGNERELAWLEYATHRLRDEPLRMTASEERDDGKLRRWKFWDRDERARDAIWLGIEAIRAWKEEG
jgi:hypothetical protein